MPIKIRGLDYFAAADVTQRLQVTRQTLWR
jgi:hypothetical protein